MTDEPHHLPNTYRGIENREPAEPPTTWTNLPDDVTVETVDHRADLEAAMLESVHTAALSIDHAAQFGDRLLDATTLNIEWMDEPRLRQLVGCLSVCLRRAYQGRQ